MMITLTENAIQQLITLVSEETDPNTHVRMFVEGGGCSGFQYGFTFTTEKDPDDIEIPAGTTSMLVDPISFQYLEDVSIDYKTDIQGSRFVIKNPNATGTCGCGSSFTV